MLSNTSELYLEKGMLEFSIIVPVYNCAEKILIVLDTIKSVLKHTCNSYELIVVDDGSTDGTLTVLEKLAQGDPSIRILSYPSNRGKGYAVKTGIMACQGSKCLFIDGDFDISPEPIGHYFSELEGCDLVVASKRHKLSRVNATRRRMFLSQSFNLFVRIATGVSVKDTQAGLKAGDSSALKRIFSLMSVSRYAFDVELLVIASKAGLKTKEMPVEITVRKAFRVKDILRMTYDVLGITYRHRIYARSKIVYKPIVPQPLAGV